MTTKLDNRKVRDESPLWSASLEFTQGVPVNNAEDPSGEYPNKNYFFGSSIHRASRGLDTIELWSKGSYKDLDLNYSVPSPSVYPYHQVTETEYGHALSLDDTPGNERVVIKHGSGAGIDMRPDGTVIVTSKRNRVEIVGGSNSVIVEGDANLNYKGNLTVNVDGDYRLNVRGDVKTDVMGNVKTDIRGSDRKRVEKTYDRTVLDNTQFRTMGNETNVTLGERTDVVNSGYTLILDGNSEIRSSSDIRISSEKAISLSAEYVSAISNNLSLLGTNGVIGGENMEHFGKTYSGPANGKGDQTTFYGTLIGLATEATSSEYAVYSKYAWSAYAASAAIRAQTVSNLEPGVSNAAGKAITKMNNEPDYRFIMDFHQNNPEWRLPTDALVRNILENTEQGIMRVRVFDSDISDRITFFDEYDKYFSTTPTIEEIRRMMRYSEVRYGPVAKVLASRGLINTNYATDLPTTVSQISTSAASTRYGSKALGNPIENTNKAFKTRDE